MKELMNLVMFLRLRRPDGIEALCEDLGVSPTDIKVLLLAWYALRMSTWFFHNCGKSLPEAGDTLLELIFVGN